MRLTIFNGSPRGKNSNTTTLTDMICQGVKQSGDHEIEICYLKKVDEFDRYVEAFRQSDVVLLAFPLYTDAMPGIVKRFIERLAPLRGREGNPSMAFLVQSGFPEAIHTQHLSLYLEKLAGRLGCRYAGIFRKGCMESLRKRSRRLFKKLFADLEQLGRILGETGQLDPVICEKHAKPVLLPGWALLLLRILNRLGGLNFIWDDDLKANGVYKQRYNAPLND